ncbi:hypothetical protein [uncultured Erythrobacter sp.]|uniref:head-tail connector protein n=1 Tax=uncultured Erythrobacter sp. TaxID=263913 RepID=UPI00261F2B8E|nr:hypothetical protein [uncultured Erythrobacter sp.]
MRRTIVQPADLSGPALAEFKDWLGISRPNEDPLLVDLLAASLATCEAFTAQAPLEQTIEERISVKQGIYRLGSRPARMLLNAELIDQIGTRSSLSGQGHGFNLDHDGVATADLKFDLEGQAVAVTLLVGIAPDWPSVPKALRQGIIRLAAHFYRDRDSERMMQPPSSVTALWRPWRTMRLT